MRKQLIVALLSGAGAFVVVYMMRRRRNTLWDQIPPKRMGTGRGVVT